MTSYRDARTQQVARLLQVSGELLATSPEVIDLLRIITDSYIETLQSLLDDYSGES